MCADKILVLTFIGKKYVPDNWIISNHTRNLQPPQYVAKLIGSQSGINRGSRVAAVGAKA